jgi:hypothetical protein
LGRLLLRHFEWREIERGTTLACFSIQVVVQPS